MKKILFKIGSGISILGLISLFVYLCYKLIIWENIIGICVSLILLGISICIPTVEKPSKNTRKFKRRSSK